MIVSCRDLVRTGKQEEKSGLMVKSGIAFITVRLEVLENILSECLVLYFCSGRTKLNLTDSLACFFRLCAHTLEGTHMAPRLELTPRTHHSYTR
jgi:hypothetical protein